MPNAAEIVRCLKHDGFTKEDGVKYCRSVATEIHYGAYTHKPDEQAYLEAAAHLEAEVKAEKLALEHVEELEETNGHLLRRVFELETTIVELTGK